MVRRGVVASRQRFLIGVIWILLVTCVACAPKQDELSLSLVWEIQVPGKMQLLWAGDNGEAILRRRPELGATYPLEYIDSHGQKVGELDWSRANAKYDTISPILSRPLETGWAAVDEAVGYVTEAKESGSSGQRIGFESLVKLIDRSGRTVWETPGPANALIFHVDESLIGCYGKDPSLLDEVTLGDRSSPNYASLVKEKYKRSQNRILILDAKTGSEVSAFDIPNAQLPDEIIDGGGQGERLLSAVEYEEDAISRIAYYGLENGALRHSVSLREALPGRRVKDVHHYGEGLAALCDDGSVSLLTPTGQILWTAKLKGAGPDGVLPNVVFSTPEGLLVVEYLPGLTATSSSVSALDSGGDTVFHVDGLRGVTRAGSTPRVFALGDSGIAGQDSLYVFDLAAGSAKTSRAVLQAVESYVVSPSGKYLLAQHRSSTGELKVAMYRLEE